jgi:3-hydroxybutyryl-CoA dehydrogenase
MASPLSASAEEKPSHWWSKGFNPEESAADLVMRAMEFIPWKGTTMNIQTIGILGAGQMGQGIAQVVAQSGRKAVLADISLDLAQNGKKKIVAGLGKLVEKGKLTAEAAKKIEDNIECGGELAAFANCDLVVEAATENITLKQKIFRDLDAACKPDAILASNTSSISITLLAAQTKRPENFIGMHFMNPVPVMKLVEIIRGLQTSDETYQAIMDLSAALGKTTVTSKDNAGFIVNRLLIPFLNEACFALQEGLGTIEDIDKGIMLGLNHPMGPFTLADFIGLDTCLAIAEVLHKELGEDKYRPAPLLRQYVAAGWLGKKTKRGFYKYQ